MKALRPPNDTEKAFALRRMMYDLLIAVKSYFEFPRVRGDYARKECLKLAGLIMIRNLNAFLYHTDYGHDDDIHVADFGLTPWAPNPKSQLDKKAKMRINKIVGHVVGSRPAPFKSDQEVLDLMLPLFRESSEFIRQCRQSCVAHYRGRVSDYARRLNPLLAELGIHSIPEN